MASTSSFLKSVAAQIVLWKRGSMGRLKRRFIILPGVEPEKGGEHNMLMGLE